MDELYPEVQSPFIEIEDAITSQFYEDKLEYFIDTEMIEKSESTLDGWDYCYAILIGLAGAFISSNKEFGEYLKDIHAAASGTSGDYDFFQKIAGKLFSHKGDYIDYIDAPPFKNRNGGNAYGLFHRLLWGHDILNLGENNPFRLMYKQKGAIGLLQAVRHLIADTCSKQGLPMPGSSFFDYTFEENGKEKTSNYLIKVSQQLSEDAFGLKNKGQEIYSHLFTIRAQDISGGAVVKTFSAIYLKARKIEDKIRKEEIKLIAYAVNFFAEAIIGTVKQNGVPYVNIPVGTAMAISFGRFCYFNYKDLKLINAETERLIKNSDELLEESKFVDEFLPQLDIAEEYMDEVDRSNENVSRLITFFGE